MLTIKLVDARKGLRKKCVELFRNERVAKDIYMYLCDGLEECDVVQPERKTGRWVLKEYLWECDQCGCRINRAKPFSGNLWNYYFCPNCGARMKEDGQDETD